MKKICTNWLFPQRRLLTAAERQLVHSVFGESLNLTEIEIVACRLILPHYALSPNGKIYFNPDNWQSDFSLLSIELQSWLIHELVHVWQVQQGIHVVAKAIFDRRYDYVIHLGKAFLQYGIEQQAQIVQDWFIKSRKGIPCNELQSCIPFLNHHA